MTYIITIVFVIIFVTVISFMIVVISVINARISSDPIETEAKMRELLTLCERLCLRQSFHRWSRHRRREQLLG